MSEITTNTNELINDISVLINNAKVRVAIKANAKMTMLYWHIGERIQEEILKSTRAEYGQEVIKTLAQHLHIKYGKGFTSVIAKVKGTSTLHEKGTREFGVT